MKETINECLLTITDIMQLMTRKVNIALHLDYAVSNKPKTKKIPIVFIRYNSSHEKGADNEDSDRHASN